MDVKTIDKNMADNIIEGKRVDWYLPSDTPLRLSGFAFWEEDNVYRRFPLRTKKLFERVNPYLNELCENTAGGQVSFGTNSESIFLKARLKSKHNMVNMPATGQCGFDCYCAYNGERHKFFGVTKWDIENTTFSCEVASALGQGHKDVIINFPLYMGVEEVMVGVNAGSNVSSSRQPKLAPMAFYGTSITQGGCASRPGMVYTNILSRRFECEVLNYGFSANGLGEYEVAELIASAKKEYSLIALDYEANAGSNGRLEKSLEGFIKILRKSHPNTPILVMSRIPHTMDFYNTENRDSRNRLRAFQQGIVEKLNNNGDNNIYFLNGYDLLGENWDECTVDFIHPTDLGFLQMAEGIGEKIASIFSKSQ